MRMRPQSFTFSTCKKSCDLKGSANPETVNIKNTGKSLIKWISLWQTILLFISVWHGRSRLNHLKRVKGNETVRNLNKAKYLLIRGIGGIKDIGYTIDNAHPKGDLE